MTEELEIFPDVNQRCLTNQALRLHQLGLAGRRQGPGEHNQPLPEEQTSDNQSDFVPEPSESTASWVRAYRDRNAAYYAEIGRLAHEEELGTSLPEDHSPDMESVIQRARVKWAQIKRNEAARKMQTGDADEQPELLSVMKGASSYKEANRIRHELDYIVESATHFSELRRLAMEDMPEQLREAEKYYSREEGEDAIRRAKNEWDEIKSGPKRTATPPGFITLHSSDDRPHRVETRQCDAEIFEEPARRRMRAVRRDTRDSYYFSNDRTGTHNFQDEETEAGVPPIFSGYETVNGIAQLGDFLAGTKYIVSLSGPFYHGSEYGIAIFPCGEEAMIFPTLQEAYLMRKSVREDGEEDQVETAEEKQVEATTTEHTGPEQVQETAPASTESEGPHLVHPATYGKETAQKAARSQEADAGNASQGPESKSPTVTPDSGNALQHPTPRALRALQSLLSRQEKPKKKGIRHALKSLFNWKRPEPATDWKLLNDETGRRQLILEIAEAVASLAEGSSSKA